MEKKIIQLKQEAADALAGDAPDAATILGLGIGPAVAMHEGSTLVVVFNALRLLGYRDRSA